MIRPILAAAALLLPLCALADESQTLDELQQQLAVLSKRVAALEAENRAALKAPGAGHSENASIAIEPAAEPGPRFDVFGDFRYRYEEIDVQGQDTRSRSRIRVRAGVTTDVSEAMEIGLGLATGGDSPTSSTQTLGDGGSKKGIALDLAYVRWRPTGNSYLVAGKFANPLFRVPGQSLLWDDKWRPEGVAIGYESDRGFLTFVGTWLESDSNASAREFAHGIHGGIYRTVGAARITAGAGYFDLGTAGKGTFYGDDLAFAGNSFTCSVPDDNSSCVYLNDYREVELFAAVDLNVGGVATTLYGHYLENLGANQQNNGWTAGARFKGAIRNQAVQFDYYYRDLEADAVYAQLTDSDFGGGGSDASGHYFKTSWRTSDALVLSLTWFDNQLNAGSNPDLDYNRLQLNADYRY